MKMLRAFPAALLLYCCAFTATTAYAQDPGQTTPAPNRIQGPSGGPLALPPSPDGGAAAPEEPLKFKMYAMLGQKKAGTAGTLDEELKPLEDVLKKLPYTDYQKIAVEERETPDGVETQFPINPVYTLNVQPSGKDEQGAAKLDIHVDLMQDGKLVKALTAQATAKPGDALLLRGMPLPPGDLVIVFQRDAGNQGSQGQQGDQNQDQKDQQQQQNQKQNEQSKDQDKQQDQKKDEEKKKDQEKKDEEKKEAQQAEQQEAKPDQKDEDKKDEAEKKDKGNLDAILQSLENTDRKEQEELRNKRDRIDFKGDWW